MGSSWLRQNVRKGGRLGFRKRFSGTIGAQDHVLGRMPAEKGVLQRLGHRFPYTKEKGNRRLMRSLLKKKGPRAEKKTYPIGTGEGEDGERVCRSGEKKEFDEKNPGEH